MTTYWLTVRGLGTNGMSTVDLRSPAGDSSPPTLSDLHTRITSLSGIPAAQQLLFVDGRTFFPGDAESEAAFDVQKAVQCGGVHLVREVRSQGWPSVRARFAYWRARGLVYCGGALATISACCVLWQIFGGGGEGGGVTVGGGGEALRKQGAAYSFLPFTKVVVKLLRPLFSTLTVPLLVCAGAMLGAAANTGHWLAGFPILPAALLTLVNKGAQQNEASCAAAAGGGRGAAGGGLDRLEMSVAEIIVNYMPNLVREAAQLIGAASKGAMVLHQQYGGTRLRLVCADGIAIDGMHVRPHSGSGSSCADVRKCYIVANGNAEFYELDGLQQQSHSNAARYGGQGFDVLLFNYRGVGVSEGFPTRDGLVLDLHAVVDFAIRPLPHGLGISPSRVVVCGRSLGGAISTVLLGNEMSDLPLVLCNTRSFSKLSKTAELLLGQQYGTRIGRLASFGIGILGWELDALSAWRKVRGFKWFETVPDDEIILSGAKLSDGLAEEANTSAVAAVAGNLTEKDLWKVDLATLSGVSSHNRMLHANEYRKRHDMLMRALKHSESVAAVDAKKEH